MRALPPTDDMYQALVGRDAEYDGIFVAAIHTTGIFCRPTCPARKPRPENVEYFPSPHDALAAGYRPCRRCRPMEPAGRTPRWLAPLLDAVEEDPARRWRDGDLRSLGLEPGRVRRWFHAHHGMTFHAYHRARRLGIALGHLRHGMDLSRAAFDSGFESLSGFRDAFAQLFGAPPGRARHTQQMVVTRLLTPLGPMLAGATGQGVCLLEFADRRMLETQITRLRKHLGCAIGPGGNRHIDALEEQLRQYFSGARSTFELPLVLPGTPFQQDVWSRLRDIPFGTTTSYRDLARAVGRPDAVRAVGRANGDNRLAIIVPCHRVVGSDGQLCGYGGGLWRKQYLLDLETVGAESELAAIA